MRWKAHADADLLVCLLVGMRPRLESAPGSLLSWVLRLLHFGRSAGAALSVLPALPDPNCDTRRFCFPFAMSALALACSCIVLFVHWPAFLSGQAPVAAQMPCLPSCFACSLPCLPHPLQERDQLAATAEGASRLRFKIQELGEVLQCRCNTNAPLGGCCTCRPFCRPLAERMVAAARQGPCNCVPSRAHCHKCTAEGVPPGDDDAVAALPPGNLAGSGAVG